MYRTELFGFVWYIVDENRALRRTRLAPVVVEPATPRPAAATRPCAPTSGLGILIVDNYGDSADSLGMILRIMGNDIRTAHDGEEAVRAATAFRPDVVLLDIGLPKLNGYDACPIGAALGPEQRHRMGPTQDR